MEIKKQIDGKDYIVYDDVFYKIDNILSEFSARDDELLFRKLVESNKHTIGHIHGNVSEEKKQHTLARTLPQELIDKYDIRDTGLNISVADIWQHEAFKQIAKEHPSIMVAQTIIMYNGDMIMLGDEGIKKVNNIQSILQSGNIVSIST